MKEQDITFAYQYYLNRESDPEGMALYKGIQTSLTNLEYDLFNSDEYKKNENIIMYPQTVVGRKICILPEAKIVFVPIAKNAHTSVTEALLSFRGIDWKSLPINDELVLEFGDEEHRFHSAIESNDTGLLLKDLPPRMIHEALSSPEYLRVSVIRDPLKRLISAYNHLIVQSADNPVTRLFTDPIWEYFGKKLGDKISFIELLKYISCKSDSQLDPHFAPQYTFINGFNIEKLIPIEKVSVIESLVEERSGKPFKINHLNTHSASVKPEAVKIDENVRRFINERYWLDNKLYQEAVANYQD